MKTLSALANTERYKDSVKIVGLIDATFDQYGLATIVRNYGSRKYVNGATTYLDLIAERGLKMTFSRLEPRGGLASIGGFSLDLRDEEGESEQIDQYVLANDEIIYYLQFVTGAEDLSDRIELLRGVVDTSSTHKGTWSIRLISGMARALRKFPNQLINPFKYPGAPNPGDVIPVPFGAFDTGPGDGSGLSLVLAPYVCTDLLALQFTAGFENKTVGTVYQWYDQAQRFAEVLTTSTSNGILTASDPARKMLIRPVRAKIGNDVIGWKNAADDDTSTGASLSTGENLDLWFGGTPKLGTLTGLSVEIVGSGNYTYTIKDDTSTIAGPTAASGNTSIALTPGDFADWDINLINIELDGPGSGSATLHEIYLDLRFNDFQSFEGTAPRLFGKIDGWADVASYYQDGAIISAANARLDNPAHQLCAIFRGKSLIGRPVAEVNMTSIANAATSRDGWKFTFPLSTLREKAFLDKFGLQAGLHIFHDEGQFTVAALDETRLAQHFFHGDYHMPVGEADQAPSEWDYDFHVEPVKTQEIINEFALHFRLHPATGKPTASEIASGQYRLTGSAVIDSAAQTLTDSSATFITDGVGIGERIYLTGDQDYKVTSINSETQMGIAAVSGGAITAISGSVVYYIGPHLDGRMLRSQLAFKTVNALGVRQELFTDEGGFISDLVADPATAVLLREHVVKWFSQPRRRIRFPLFHSAVNLQLGDVLYTHHAKLPPSRRAVALTTISGAWSDSSTILTVPAGTAGLIRENDHLFSWSSIEKKPEVFQVGTPDYPNGQFAVTRGLLNTDAIEFANGDAVYRVIVKWMVVGLKPLTPDDPAIRVEAVEMPNSYKPVGRIAPTGTASYRSEDEVTQSKYGFITNHAGRILEEKEDSATSWVGPPIVA